MEAMNSEGHRDEYSWWPQNIVWVAILVIMVGIFLFADSKSAKSAEEQSKTHLRQSVISVQESVQYKVGYDDVFGTYVSASNIYPDAKCFEEREYFFLKLVSDGVEFRTEKVTFENLFGDDPKVCHVREVLGILFVIDTEGLYAGWARFDPFKGEFRVYTEEFRDDDPSARALLEALKDKRYVLN